MVQIICDACGQQCGEAEFNIPEYKSITVRSGKGSMAVITSFKSLENSKMNLCRNCQEKIGNFMFKLKEDKRSEVCTNEAL